MVIAGVAAIAGVGVVETAEIVRAGGVGAARGIGAVRAMEVAIGVGVARATGEGPAEVAIVVRIVGAIAVPRVATKFLLKSKPRPDLINPFCILHTLHSPLPLHRNDLKYSIRTGIYKSS